jgi:hypothetical protein
MLKEGRSVKLQPPDTSPEKTISSPRRRMFLLFAVFMAINGILLLLWFSRIHEEGGRANGGSNNGVEVEQVNGRERVSSVGIVSPAEVVEKRSVAEKALQGWLHIHAKGKAMSVEVWADKEYAFVLDAAAKGDAGFAEKRYLEAAVAYQQATSLLAEILAGKEQKVEQLLRAGEKALQDGNGKVAKEVFVKVLAVKPGNSKALEGVERAAVADTVADLVHQADRLFLGKDWADAQVKLRQAVALDQRNRKAQVWLVKVDRAIEEQALQEAMGAFFSALGRHQYGRAEKSLAVARKIRPGSKAVENGGLQLARAQKTDRIKRLEKLLQDAMAKEQWQQASELIEKILTTDSRASVAVQHQVKVNRRKQLDQRLETILSMPLRLQDEKPYAEAVSLLKYARTVEASGPRLAGQQQVLASLIVSMRQGVRVKLMSDNLSKITVYKVGNLGMFREKELQLYPGAYTVVSRRAGYRDVRKQLSVPVNSSSLPVMNIRCEEPI